MINIVDRLKFDAVRCELQFSKGVAGNIDEAAAEIERLRAALWPFAMKALHGTGVCEDDYRRAGEAMPDAPDHVAKHVVAAGQQVGK